MRGTGEADVVDVDERVARVAGALVLCRWLALAAIVGHLPVTAPDWL